MIWLTWRLQRTELLYVGLMLALLGSLLLATRDDLVAVSKPLTATDCSSGMEPGCQSEPGLFFNLVRESLPWLNALPLFASLLIVLPLISELEHGAYRLAWTQSMTRRQWVRTRFGIIVLLSVAAGSVISLAFRMWSSPSVGFFGRLGLEDYDLRGILPIGHMVYAVGLMLAVGYVVRRPIPTIAVASTIYVGTRVPFMSTIRERLIDPVTKASDEYIASWDPGNWHLFSYWKTATGEQLSEVQLFNLCRPPGMQTIDPFEQCIAQNGLTEYAVYHPASHYWPLQFIESGIFLGAGAALIGFAAWWVLRRVE